MLKAGIILAALAVALPLEASAQETVKKYPRDVITREEIIDRAPDAKNAYEVVQRLRPQFLRTRPSGSMQNSAPVPVRLYVDGSSRPTVASLRELLKEAVIEIAYLNGNDATTRFGTGHENGAIVVRTGA